MCSAFSRKVLQLKPESIVLLSKESTVLYHMFIRLICTLLFSFLQTNANSCWLVSPWTNSKITAFSANLLFCCHAFALLLVWFLHTIHAPKKVFTGASFRLVCDAKLCIFTLLLFSILALLRLAHINHINIVHYLSLSFIIYYLSLIISCIQIAWNSHRW